MTKKMKNKKDTAMHETLNGTAKVGSIEISNNVEKSMRTADLEIFLRNIKKKLSIWLSNGTPLIDCLEN